MRIVLQIGANSFMALPGCFLWLDILVRLLLAFTIIVSVASKASPERISIKRFIKTLFPLNLLVLVLKV